MLGIIINGYLLLAFLDFELGRKDFMSESDQPPLPRIKLINYLKFYNFPRTTVAFRADNTFIFLSIIEFNIISVFLKESLFDKYKSKKINLWMLDRST